MKISNSIYKRNSIQLLTWPSILALLIVFSSCNLTYTGLKNTQKIEKHFGPNALNGEIKVSELSKLLYEKSKDSSNFAFIESALQCQNIGLVFDSSGHLKNLMGSDYKRDFDFISLASDFYGFDPYDRDSSRKNRVPEKLDLHFNDLFSIVNMKRLKQIVDSNKIIISILPNQTNRAYFKTVDRMNWRKGLEKRNSMIVLIKNDEL